MFKASVPARTAPPGSTLGITAPGAPAKPERVQLGLAELSRRGYQVRMPLDPSLFYGRYEHLFSSDSRENRAQGLRALIADAEVSAIIAVRGAYGSLEVLPLLDFDDLALQRKLIVGSSDITALLLQVVSRTGLAAIHGPTLSNEIADSAADAGAGETTDALLKLLAGSIGHLRLQGQKLRGDAARGPILAGNLTMLTTLVGTPLDVDYSGVILVIEEIGEAPFRIHRSLTQLKLAGKLDSLAALCFGRFSRCTASHGPTVEDVLHDACNNLLRGTSYPIISGLEVGHYGKNMPLPLGCLASVEEGLLTVLESPFAPTTL